MRFRVLRVNILVKNFLDLPVVARRQATINFGIRGLLNLPYFLHH